LREQQQQEEVFVLNHPNRDHLIFCFVAINNQFLEARMMNSYQQNQPPSYESVISGSQGELSLISECQLFVTHHLAARSLIRAIHIVGQIGEITTTTTTQAMPSAYPVLPSAPTEFQTAYQSPPPPQQSYYPAASQNYGSIAEVIQAQPIGQQLPPNVNIVVVGGCPVCRIGILEDDYSCLGICLAIFCFPIGILCCLACKNKRCSNCGTII